MHAIANTWKIMVKEMGNIMNEGTHVSMAYLYQEEDRNGNYSSQKRVKKKSLKFIQL
jgi:hypothetical protein